MMKSAPAAPDPRRRDEIDREAGKWSKASGKRQRIAYATGMTPQRASQIAGGDPTGAPQRFYQHVGALARHDQLDPYPVLAGAHLVVEEEKARRLRDPAGAHAVEVGRYSLAAARTTVALHRYIRSDSPGDLRALLEASEAESHELLRMVGTTRVLIRRWESVR